MVRRTVCGVLLALIVLLVGLWVAPVGAQQYAFSVDKNISHVYVNKDGSVDVEYWLTFTCQPGYHDIDIVDIGMPNDDYDLSSVRADIGGVQLTDVRPSEYVKPGVEIHLGSKEIQGGQTGTLHVRFNAPKMVYYDDEDESYASVEFVPTWFSQDSVRGTTYLEVNIHFPVGVVGDQTKWHYQEFTSTSLVDDRLVFTWVNEKASGAKPYQFGVSFPNQYVDVVYKAPSFDFAAITKLFSFLESPFCWVVGLWGLMILVSLASNAAKKRRRMRYLPPSLSVEGVGVKRGLTAVEAAILLEIPLNKILTMILFGLLKKGAVTVLSDDPLKLEVAAPRPQDLRDYEEGFLDCVSDKGTLSEKDLRKVIVKLVQDVNQKVKGFSRKDTAAYYRDIVSRAWQQVESDETPEIKSQHFDEALEWMMMDEDFDDRTGRTFREGPVFVPMWWGRYRPWATSAPSPRPSTTAAPTSKRGPVSLPTLPGAAFAGTIVTGMQKTADKVVSSVERFTGGVTQATNPPPVRASSGRSGGGRSGGGYSCACACACAGCACACAGGGR